MNIKSLGVVVSLLVSDVVSAIEVRQAKDVFARWIDPASPYFQKCINVERFGREEIKPFPQRYTKAMLPVRGIIQALVCDEKGEVDINKLRLLHKRALQKTKLFVRQLEKAGLLSSALSDVDSAASFRTMLSRYTGLFKFLLCDQAEKSEERAFAVANNFVEYCFGEKNSSLFRKKLQSKKFTPVASFLYAGMWQTLSGNGWKYWHQETLNRLAHYSQAGKIVVYIAGGSDVYQLLKHGIYNIKVIDPLLPVAQDEYYADQWEWLVSNKNSTAGVSDELHLDVGERHIVARRSNVSIGRRVKIVLDTGDEIRPPSGVTKWIVFENGIEQGALIFERRFALQNDFVQKDNEVLLMSFNELFFIASPENQGGWPIDPHALPENFLLEVKQLKNPVTKTMIENMAWVEESEKAFLRLGTSVK